MPNYKETPISGDSYQRSHRMIIENRRNDTPHISFLKERVLNLNGEVLGLDAGVRTIYFDGNKEFPLVNPLDDSPLGVVGSHQQFQIMLYSLYFQDIKDEEAEQEARALELAGAAAQSSL